MLSTIVVLILIFLINVYSKWVIFKSVWHNVVRSGRPCSQAKSNTNTKFAVVIRWGAALFEMQISALEGCGGGCICWSNSLVWNVTHNLYTSAAHPSNTFPLGSIVNTFVLSITFATPAKTSRSNQYQTQLSHLNAQKLQKRAHLRHTAAHTKVFCYFVCTTVQCLSGPSHIYIFIFHLDHRVRVPKVLRCQYISPWPSCFLRPLGIFSLPLNWPRKQQAIDLSLEIVARNEGVCVCVCVCACVYVFLCACACVFVHVCVCACLCMCLCMCMCVCACVCLSVRVCVCCKRPQNADSHC